MVFYIKLYYFKNKINLIDDEFKWDYHRQLKKKFHLGHNSKNIENHCLRVFNKWCLMIPYKVIFINYINLNRYIIF